MPTMRPTKRFLLPLDPGKRKVFLAMLDDQSQLLGISHSDTIIKVFEASVLPATTFPRDAMLSVYAGQSLFNSVGNTLLANVSGIAGAVIHPDYLAIVDFGLEKVRQSGLNYVPLDSLDVGHNLRENLEHVVDCLENVVRSSRQHNPDSASELKVMVRYGRELVEALSRSNTLVSAFALAAFTKDIFGEIGERNLYAIFLSGLFHGLGEVVSTDGAPGGAYVSCDTPALRLKWQKVLEWTCHDW